MQQCYQIVNSTIHLFMITSDLFSYFLPSYLPTRVI